VIGKPSLEERHNERHLLRIVVAALPIKTDKSAAPANLFLHVHVRVDHAAAQNLDPSRLLAGTARFAATLSRTAADETGHHHLRAGFGKREE